MTTALATTNRETALDCYDTPAVGQAIDQLESELGGRQPLIDALLHCPPDPNLSYVAGLLADPRNDARKLSSLCKLGKISIGEFLEAFKRGSLAKATVVALQKVAAATPAIVEDLVARSVVHETDCLACRGKGRIQSVSKGEVSELVCLPCDGTGRVFQSPDFTTQKFVLTELAGMGKAAAPQVVIDQRAQVNVLDASPGGHGKLMAGLDRLLYARPVGQLATSRSIDPFPNPPYTAPESADEFSTVEGPDRDPGPDLGA